MVRCGPVLHHLADGRRHWPAITPNPGHGQKAAGLPGDFCCGLEAHLQASLDLHELIWKRLELAGVLVVHVRHADAQPACGQFTQHLLHFSRSHGWLGNSQRGWQTKRVAL